MVRRLARCIREFKWAAILSPLCMIGEVAMEILIPTIMQRMIDYGIEAGNVPAVLQQGLQLILVAICSLICACRLPMV